MQSFSTTGRPSSGALSPRASAASASAAAAVVVGLGITTALEGRVVSRELGSV
jgi:hypothetical protein